MVIITFCKSSFPGISFLRINCNIITFRKIQILLCMLVCIDIDIQILDCEYVVGVWLVGGQLIYLSIYLFKADLSKLNANLNLLKM